VSAGPNGLVAVTERLADKLRIAHLEYLLDDLAQRSAAAFIDIERLTLEAATARSRERTARRLLAASQAQLWNVHERIGQTIQAYELDAAI
jgi:hypothetical protein